MGKVVDGEGPSPVLRPACEAIRTLLASGTRDDARMRHRIGEIIVGIKKARDKYGARAVEEIARAVGTNVHTLYRCAAVAECWSEAQIAALLLRTNAHGQPLSWSQLVLIAGMTSPRRRAELIEQTLRDALTVRQLLVLVETAGKSGGRDGALVVLQRVVRTTERWSQAAAAMHEELLAELEGASSATGEPADLIERAIAAQESLQAVVHKQLQRLRAERGRLQPRRAPPADRRSEGLLLAGVRPR